ncbi:MAG: ABC transporter permease [Candidatus Aureabacteria bacterium]|nr:ABC transporter permease [Candidatus Auribacterota bacterium]
MLTSAFYHHIRSFISRFLKVHFAGSRLKLAWVLLTPLIISLAIACVFKEIFRIHDPALPHLILVGYLSWQFFAGTLTQGHRLLLDQRHLYKQLSGNRHFFLAGFVSFRFILNLPGLILVCVFIWISKSFSPSGVLLFFLALFFLYVMTMGLTYLFSSWTVFYPDLSHGLETGLLFYLWLSPVFYSIADMPAELKWISLINPLAWILDLMHHGLNLKSYLPPLLAGAAIIASSVLILYFGVLFHLKHHSEMLKRL